MSEQFEGDERRNQRIHELSLVVARMEEKLTASERALEVAKRDVDRRLEEMNEMRAQINNERGSYIVRTEFYAKYDALIATINNFQKFQHMTIGGLVVLQALMTVILKYWK